MKIGNKISLIYSMITIGLVVITALIFFFVTSNLTQSIYFNYLEEKAHALAEERFSEDELDPVKYRNVVIRRQNSIPTSKEMFINLADHTEAKKQLMEYLDQGEIERLFANQTIRFEERQEVGIAFVYYDNTGTFAVVVLSRNPFIDDINKMLLLGLIALVLLSAGVLYSISRLYALRVFNRIDMDYQAEKMFVNNASHEINNPLTAIQGECEVALMIDHDAAAYRDSLERISKETNRIINIMRELLQFSHAKGGKIDKSKMQQIRISKIVEIECQGNTSRNKKQDITKDKNQDINLNINNDFHVYADVELLRIAIHNLLSNAKKYSGGNPVTITIDKPHLIIEDHGIGIPESDLKHIFQPFYRASNVGSVSGKGIGLALSKSILERLGASIEVSSNKPSGTIFKVTF